MQGHFIDRVSFPALIRVFRGSGTRPIALVPAGDDAALARALCATLEKAPPQERLIERGRFFSVDRAVEQYERLLLGANVAPDSVVQP